MGRRPLSALCSKDPLGYLAAHRHGLASGRAHWREASSSAASFYLRTHPNSVCKGLSVPTLPLPEVAPSRGFEVRSDCRNLQGCDSLHCTPPAPLAAPLPFLWRPALRRAPLARVASTSLPPPALRFHRPQAASTGYDPCLEVATAMFPVLSGSAPCTACARAVWSLGFGRGAPGQALGSREAGPVTPPAAASAAAQDQCPGPAGMIIPPETPAALRLHAARAAEAAEPRPGGRILSTLAGPAIRNPWRRGLNLPPPDPLCVIVCVSCASLLSSPLLP